MLMSEWQIHTLKATSAAGIAGKLGVTSVSGPSGPYRVTILGMGTPKFVTPVLPRHLFGYWDTQSLVLLFYQSTSLAARCTIIAIYYSAYDTPVLAYWVSFEY